MGFGAPSWADLSLLLIGSVVIASLLGAAWAQWERARQDPWLRLLHGATAKLQRAGLPVAANAPPRQLAKAVQAHAQPGAGTPATPAAHALELQRIQDWLLRLEAWRYAPPAQSPARARRALGTLRREFHHLRWPQPPYTQPFKP